MDEYLAINNLDQKTDPENERAYFLSEEYLCDYLVSVLGTFSRILKDGKSVKKPKDLMPMVIEMGTKLLAPYAKLPDYGKKTSELFSMWDENQPSKIVENISNPVFPNLIDVVKDSSGKISFLIKNENTDCGFLIRDYWVIDHTAYWTPKESKLLWDVHNINDLFSVPPHVNDITLFNDIEKAIKKIVVLDKDSSYKVLVAYIFSTYFKEQNEIAPILNISGPLGMGKSTCGKILSRLCYRGFRLETVEEARLFRLLSLNLTLIIDVENFSEKSIKKNDLFLQAYQRGNKFVRVMTPDAPSTLESLEKWDSFGHIIIIDNGEIKSDPLKSRTIEIKMGIIEGNLRFDFPEEELIQLHARLLQFRLMHLNDNLIERHVPFNGRQADIARSILKIPSTYFPTESREIIQRLNEIYINISATSNDKFETKLILNTLVVLGPKVMSNIIQNNGRVIKLKEIRDEIIRISGEFFSKNPESKDEFTDEEREEKLIEGVVIPYKKLKKLLRDLGFEFSRDGSNSNIVHYDVKLLDKLCEKYDVKKLDYIEIVHNFRTEFRKDISILTPEKIRRKTLKSDYKKQDLAELTGTQSLQALAKAHQEFEQFKSALDSENEKRAINIFVSKLKARNREIQSLKEQNKSDSNKKDENHGE
jgi:hypothetical protein